MLADLVNRLEELEYVFQVHAIVTIFIVIEDAAIWSKVGSSIDLRQDIANLLKQKYRRVAAFALVPALNRTRAPMPIPHSLIVDWERRCDEARDNGEELPPHPKDEPELRAWMVGVSRLSRNEAELERIIAMANPEGGVPTIFLFSSAKMDPASYHVVVPGDQDMINKIKAIIASNVYKASETAMLAETTKIVAGSLEFYRNGQASFWVETVAKVGELESAQ